jgi:hypothetical protein
LNQILRRQTSRSHYGSKVPAVTVTVNTEWVSNLFDDRSQPNGNKLRTYRKFKSSLNVS